MGKNNIKIYILGAVFIIGLAIFFFFSGLFQQSVLSVSQVDVRSDSLKGVYWIATISANGVRDGVTFLFEPRDYTFVDTIGSFLKGTKVEPQTGVLIDFSARENSCAYQLVKISKTSSNPLLYLTRWRVLEYYQLKSFERSLLVDVCIDGGNCKVVDATSILKRTAFTVNGGELVVESQGALVGKRDCSNNQNVALMFVDGKQFFVSENDLLYQWGNMGDLFNVDRYSSWTDFIKNRVTMNLGFTDNFDSVVVSSDKSKVTGYFLVGQGQSTIFDVSSDAIFGSGVLTVTADAKVFKSVFVVPQSVCDVSVSLSAVDIVEDGSGTAKMTVKSDGACAVTYDVSISRGSVTPKSGTINFDKAGSKSKSLSIKASSTSGAYTLSVQVCSGNQFTADECDSASVTKNFVQSEDDTGLRCGDGVCSASIGESFTNCPKDCSQDEDTLPPDELSCEDKLGGLIIGVPVMSEKCGLWCKWGLSKPTLVNSCSYDYTLLIILAFVLIVLSVVVFFVAKKKKNSRRGRR